MIEVAPKFIVESYYSGQSSSTLQNISFLLFIVPSETGKHGWLSPNVFRLGIGEIKPDEQFWIAETWNSRRRDENISGLHFEISLLFQSVFCQFFRFSSKPIVQRIYEVGLSQGRNMSIRAKKTLFFWEHNFALRQYFLARFFFKPQLLDVKRSFLGVLKVGRPDEGVLGRI